MAPSPIAQNRRYVSQCSNRRIEDELIHMPAVDALVGANINGGTLRRRYRRIDRHAEQLLDIHVRSEARIYRLALPSAVGEPV